ncbi:RNA-binding domain-containing protein [Gigaspora margarita]|uniref:RNA-binding domain-containing protein n=1 Tax=Gigaspora margarita TaxID=4874 RepID=A0A8H4ENC2_GIGMA|nr:RNA-binding domain-containing protein [Gigaspora margarita]
MQDEIPQNEQNTKDSSLLSPIYSKTTLFVRKIPYDATDSEFEAFFSEIGPLRSCFIIKETKNLDDSLQKDNTINTDNSQPYTGEKEQNRGFGFVQYVLNQDAERALKELKKVKFRGQRTLKMEFALKKHEKPPKIEKKSIKLNNAKKPKVEKTEKKSSKKYVITNRTLVVEGLPNDVTRKKIYKKVRKFGYVEDIIFPIEERKNIAHITFKTERDAVEGLKRLDGHIFHESKMNAKLLAEKKASIDKKCRLIVRNIPWEYQEPELLKIFSAHGKVVEVNLPRKHPNGPLRGFAYIQYKKVDEAERAINAMNETVHHGRTIAVDWSLPKDKYLEAMKSQQGKHDYEQNNDHDIDSYTEESEEEPEKLSENETDESENQNEKSDSDSYENDLMDIDESEIDSVEDRSKNKNSVKNKNNTLSEDTVLFIRNISFEATEEELSDIFRPFGPLRYCVITRDDTTGRSRGTGFVCFEHKKHADACLEEVKNVGHIGFDSIERSESLTNEKKRKGIIYKSVLTADPSNSQAHKFTLHGRVLSIVKAVDKDEAHRLTEENKNKKQREDRRNIYLIKEGVIFPNTPDAALLTSSEVVKRSASFSTRKNLLAKNPNLFISKTRLSVRNLPLSVDEKKLKNLGKESIKKFKEEVKNGKRVDLTKTEKLEGWDKLVHIKQAKIVRSKDRIDSTMQKLRSKGYGFLEYTQHSHALASLRYLNNNPDIFGEKRRLIVEFAIENNIILKKRAGLSKNRGNDIRKFNKADDNNNSNDIEVTKLNGNSQSEKIFRNDKSNNNLKRKVEMIKSEDQAKKRKKIFHKKSPKSPVNGKKNTIKK